MSGPLDGILVVALEQAVAAPFCTMRLADSGARVIKIERPDGDFARRYDDMVRGESAYFVWLNQGKESLVLDFKQPEDARLLEKLLAKADVFVQNLLPGAAERAGFGSKSLRARHPRLVTCDISGYGEWGPYRGRKAYDLLIQCETGLASVTGSPEGAGRVGVSVADICCGMNAHAGILQALYDREHTGRGRAVAVSLFDGIAEWMTVPLLQYKYGDRAPARVGFNHPSIAPYGDYAARGGHRIVLAVQNEREWQRFCADVLGNPGLAEDRRFANNSLRCEHRAELNRILDTVFAQMTDDELAARLTGAGVAFGAINTVADLSAHPQLRKTEVATPSGSITIPAPPIRFEDMPHTPRVSPALGQHSAAVRKEFG